MNFRIVIISIVVILLILSEIYIYNNIRVAFKDSKYQTIVSWMYWITFSFVLISLSYGIFQLINNPGSSSNRTWGQNFIIGFTFTIIVTKIILALLFLMVDISRFVTYLANKLNVLFRSNPTEFSLESRRKFLTQSALALASIPFASFIYGMTYGKYNYKVKKHTLHFDNLPDAFDGYRIVQISDIHAGSFDSPEDVKRGIEMINEQQPNILFFTGDLVNNKADEIDPFIEMFRTLKADDGIYSCLGNHDYGDYIQWNSPKEKATNLEKLKQQHANMNFNLLLNEHRTISKNGEQIAIAGVENWGLPPFPQHGDLEKAVHQLEAPFTILLSHDPTHWDEKVIPHQRKIDLTLSGHTHGMQFGIEIPGIKWSPVKYKYEKWAGIYERENQYLHVNRGFGFLGFPGRVGIWPEITVIELRKKQPTA